MQALRILSGRVGLGRGQTLLLGRLLLLLETLLYLALAGSRVDRLGAAEDGRLDRSGARLLNRHGSRRQHDLGPFDAAAFTALSLIGLLVLACTVVRGAVWSWPVLVAISIATSVLVSVAAVSAILVTITAAISTVAAVASVLLAVAVALVLVT